jgi:hypothetical protein
MTQFRRPYSARKAYPSEHLRHELLTKVGVPADEHELRSLRTLAYRRHIHPPEGATADELARLLISAREPEQTA